MAGLVTVVAAGVLAGCEGLGLLWQAVGLDDASGTPQPEKPPRDAGDAGDGGPEEIPLPPSRLVYLERVVKGPDPTAPLPIVLALHGFGDEPRHFIKVFDGFDVPSRIVIPCAPDRYRDGFSWIPSIGTEEQSEQATERIADRLGTLITEVAEKHRSPPRAIVTGYSIGAVVALVTAVRHPDKVVAAVPVAGHLPEAFTPEALPGDPPVIRALHGNLDDVYPPGDARRGVNMLKGLGFDATIRLYRGERHRLTERLGRELHGALAELLGDGSAGEPGADGGPPRCTPCDGDAGPGCSLCEPEGDTDGGAADGGGEGGP